MKIFKSPDHGTDCVELLIYQWTRKALILSIDKLWFFAGCESDTGCRILKKKRTSAHLRVQIKKKLSDFKHLLVKKTKKQLSRSKLTHLLKVNSTVIINLTQWWNLLPQRFRALWNCRWGVSQLVVVIVPPSARFLLPLPPPLRRQASTPTVFRWL